MEEDNGNIAHGMHDAGFHAGIQHGSAAGIEPPAGAPANTNNAGGSNAPISPPGLPSGLAAATIAAVNFGASPATRRRPTDTGSPLLEAERRRRLNGEHAPSLEQAGGRASSRSPRPVTPPATGFSTTSENAPPPSPDWNQDVPGHGASMEDLRGFVIREIGQLHANARTQAERSFEQRQDIEA